MTLNLAQFLSGHAFAFLLILSRVGIALMLFPGIGESFVSPRMRGMIGLIISFLLMPALVQQMPSMPQDMADLVMLFAREAFVGILFGSLVRLLVESMETAGSVIAIQTGLSNAVILNPVQANQSPLSSAFLGTATMALIFVSGLDHMLFGALIDTYAIFPAGEAVPLGDAAEAYIGLLGRCFAAGVGLAAPFLIVGLLLFVALALVQRLLPQVQLFMVVLPLQVWGGLAIFAVTVAAILMAWLSFAGQTLASLWVRS